MKASAASSEGQVFRIADARTASAKVSVIVPVYAVEEYLPQCIQSLIEQTYTNLEIMLVDDGSPDNCGDICDSFAGRDPRIEVIHKGNGGLSSARNAGLERANGEYICFVDSDDWVESDYVDSLLDAVVRAQADVGVCAYIHEFSTTSQVKHLSRGDSMMSADEALIALYGPDYLALTVVWNKMFCSEVFQRLRFCEGMVHEDEELAGSIFLAASRVVCIDRPLYHYRHRQGSITVDDDRRGAIVLDAAVAYENRLQLFRSQDLNPRLIRLTASRLLHILLTLHVRAQNASLDPHDSRDGLILQKIERYLPWVRPWSRVGIWGRLALQAPSLACVLYSWRLHSRRVASRLLEAARRGFWSGTNRRGTIRNAGTESGAAC